MHYSLKKLVGFNIQAIDGNIGKINEFYFDDLSWIIRYTVVNTDNWSLGRNVLISPFSIGIPDMKKQIIPVNLTIDQVENSPDIDTSKPVYRQHETELSKYYKWPLYWTGSDYGGGVFNMNPIPYPEIIGEKDELTQSEKYLSENSDPHLRSTHQVTDYGIQAIDGEIGHVYDFLINQETWAISYIVVKTKNWLPGKKVLISPHWLKEISWDEQKVRVNMTIESIKSSPEYDSSKYENVEYEGAISTKYGVDE